MINFGTCEIYTINLQKESQSLEQHYVLNILIVILHTQESSGFGISLAFLGLKSKPEKSGKSLSSKAYMLQYDEL